MRVRAGGLGDRKIVYVENEVAVVGEESGALDGRPPRRPSSRDIAARHRDDFDRQRKLAEPLDELALIDDADEAPCGGGDDLLAGEGAAAALDELARARVASSAPST